MLYTPKEYIAIVKPRHMKYLNCFAYALGLTKPSFLRLRYNVKPLRHDKSGYNPSISDAFVAKCKEFGVNVREIRPCDAVDGKTYFLVFGWFPGYDFHVVRRNPDGSYDHKPGWKYPPTYFSFEDLMWHFRGSHYSMFELD